MSKTNTLRAIHHSSKLIGLAKQLIQLRLLTVDSPARFRLMPDILPADTKARHAFLQNLYIYARIGLGLDEDRILEIFDAETDQRICTVAHSEVLPDASYIFG